MPVNYATVNWLFKKNLLLFFFCCCVINSVIATDSLPPKKLFINASGHYGFIIPHRKTMMNLIKSHIPAGEVNLTLRTSGEKSWERLYGLPEKGIGVLFADLGNPEQLGQAIGIFPFVNFPINPGRKIVFHLRSADGIGYITNPYNRVTNHKNNINGSHLNAFINLRLNTVFFPAKKIRMEAGLGLIHLSNGSWAKPNLGVNIATVNLGIGFLSSEPESKLHVKRKDDTVKTASSFYSLIAAGGPNESGKPDGDQYAGFSIYAAWWKILSPKSRICAGADVFYEFANLAEAKRDTIFDTSKPLNNLQVGIRSGYELAVGKIGLPLEMGVYLLNKNYFDGPMYHRIGIRYYANQRLILNYSLKTHWATAELLEFGVGWKF